MTGSQAIAPSKSFFPGTSVSESLASATMTSSVVRPILRDFRVRTSRRLWSMTNLPACHAKKEAAVTTSNNGRLTCDTNGGNFNRLLAIIRNLDGLTRVRSLPIDTRTIFAAPSSSAAERIRGRAGGVFGDMSERKLPLATEAQRRQLLSPHDTAMAHSSPSPANDKPQHEARVWRPAGSNELH